MVIGSARVRSLPVIHWPEPDRQAWENACRRGERLHRGGAAAHLKPITQADLERRYGYFLDHLTRRGISLTCWTAAELVSQDHVAAYVAELHGRVSSVTVYGSVYKLRRMAELIAPGRDFAWLRDIENDLDTVKVPRSKYPRLVTTTALVEAGLTLIAEAELAPQTSSYRSVTRESRAARGRERGAADRGELNRAVLSRNGVLQALLACCPIRLKNLASLELGTSFLKIGSVWWVVIEPEHAKNRRADERPVPDMLTAAIDRYVGYHRSVLARGRADAQSGPLWISSQDGRPMPQASVEAALRRTTLSTLGIEIGPHMARTAAASEVAARATDTPRLASALLQHRDPRTTEEHYNRATAHGAARAYAEVLALVKGYSDPVFQVPLSVSSVSMTAATRSLRSSAKRAELDRRSGSQ